MGSQSRTVREPSKNAHQQPVWVVNGASAPRGLSIEHGFWRNPPDETSRLTATPEHERQRRCASRHKPSVQRSRIAGAEETARSLMPAILPSLSREDHGSDPALVRRLKQAILNGPRFDAAQVDVARDLGLSARTLRRRLRSLGTTYAQTIEEVRFAFAIQCLADPMLTIDDVADRVGYTEVSNFRHAFKRWSRIAPQAFRDAIS